MSTIYTLYDMSFLEPTPNWTTEKTEGLLEGRCERAVTLGRQIRGPLSASKPSSPFSSTSQQITPEKVHVIYPSLSLLVPTLASMQTPKRPRQEIFNIETLSSYQY